MNSNPCEAGCGSLFCTRMKRIKKIKRLLKDVALVAATSSAWAALPCDGVNRSLTNERKAELAPKIAKHLGYKSVDVLQSFQSGNWSIINVDTHESDESYLFYAHDPLTSRYITLWSGAAPIHEEEAIKKWTLKNAPGIPSGLASCFAWYVTKDRDKSRLFALVAGGNISGKIVNENRSSNSLSENWKQVG